MILIPVEARNQLGTTFLKSLGKKLHVYILVMS